MRRFLAGVGFAMGFAWLFRRFRRPAPAPDHAEELRRKLAESRAGEAPAPPPGPPPPPPEVPLDERRRAVHERARDSIERMRGGDEAQPPDPV